MLDDEQEVEPQTHSDEDQDQGDGHVYHHNSSGFLIHSDGIPFAQPRPWDHHSSPPLDGDEADIASILPRRQTTVNEHQDDDDEQGKSLLSLLS